MGSPNGGPNAPLRAAGCGLRAAGCGLRAAGCGERGCGCAGPMSGAAELRGRVGWGCRSPAKAGSAGTRAEWGR